MLNQSKEYNEAGKSWGMGWNGDFIFQIENITINKTSVENLPAYLAEQLKGYYKWNFLILHPAQRC